MASRRRDELGVGALVLVALSLLAYMALQVGALQGFGDKVELRAELDDAAGLADGAMIKVAGIDVGRVASMAIDHDRAVLALEISEKAGIRQDALVRVRARSVLGEKYLELVPRSTDSPLARDGDTLETGRTPVEIDQLVNDLGPLVDAVDPAALERSIAVLTRALEEDPERIGRMLDDLELVLDNAAAVSTELPGLVEETRGAVREVRATAREARPVLARTDRVVGELEAATTDLAQTRTEVDGLIADTRVAVQEGGALVTRLEDNGDQLERILDNVEELDKWELRRLLREEGIVVRLKASEVVEVED